MVGPDRRDAAVGKVTRPGRHPGPPVTDHGRQLHRSCRCRPNDLAPARRLRSRHHQLHRPRADWCRRGRGVRPGRVLQGRPGSRRPWLCQAARLAARAGSWCRLPGAGGLEQPAHDHPGRGVRRSGWPVWHPVAGTGHRCPHCPDALEPGDGSIVTTLFPARLVIMRQREAAATRAVLEARRMHGKKPPHRAMLPMTLASAGFLRVPTSLPPEVATPERVMAITGCGGRSNWRSSASRAAWTSTAWSPGNRSWPEAGCWHI